MNPILSRNRAKIIGFLVTILVLCFISLLSMAVGQIKIPLTVIVKSFFNYNPTSTEHIILSTTRLSRTIISIFTGSALALAGALIQALTRNKLASPSIFGINSGALFFVVFAVVLLSIESMELLMFIAFLGSALAATLVFTLGELGKDSHSPIKIVLAGAAVSAFFTAFTQGMLVTNEQGLSSVIFWLGGSVSNRSLNSVIPILFFIFIAIFIAFFLSRSINLLNLGEDIAKGLGLNVFLVKLVTTIVILALAGGSVTISGNISFIGLIVPHIVRFFVGTDYRWIIPFSITFGASLLLLADIIARIVIIPEEMPIGIITALIGVPVFIYIARKRI